VPAAAGVLAVDDASCERASELRKRLCQDFSGRTLAGFGGQRLSNRPMRREQCGRSVELCWPAITVVADSLFLGRLSLRSRFVEFLLRAWSRLCLSDRRAAFLYCLPLAVARRRAVQWAF
jgi:hypothetical protein